MTVTATLATAPRPAYDGPRTQWTKPDGVYMVQLSFPVADRTFLFDMSEHGPGAEFTRATGLSASGCVGSIDGRSAFLFHADFQASSDAAATDLVEAWAEQIPDCLSARVLYWQPNEHGASSVVVATV